MDLAPRLCVKQTRHLFFAMHALEFDLGLLVQNMSVLRAGNRKNVKEALILENILTYAVEVTARQNNDAIKLLVVDFKKF